VDTGPLAPQRLSPDARRNRAARVNDASFSIGQVGMAAFGKGRAAFNNLYVEERLNSPQPRSPPLPQAGDMLRLAQSVEHCVVER